MAQKKFTREELDAKRVVDLKEMCVYELDIPGMTKKRKEVVIDAIMAKYGEASTAKTSAISTKAEPIKGVEFSGHSILSKPEMPFGKRTSTTIQVSCGASSGNFPVAGRSVKEVGEFLREVLNVDRLSTGLVNGKEVDPDYLLKPGDNLEFLKPAGKKG